VSSKVLYQGPCPKCGSSDAYTHYQDGTTHCFSCGYHPHSSISGYVRKQKEDVEDDDKFVNLPDDLSNEYGQEALTWVDQYGLKAVDLLRANVKWSARRKQLIFVYKFMDKPGIGLLQARNFAGGPKYYNEGDAKRVMPIYHYTKAGHTSTLTIVEDAISAIKITRDIWVDAMPLLGSYLPLHKITQIKKLGYTDVIVWLDHDKYKEAVSMAEKISYTGILVRVVRTDLDPKMYDSSQIAKHLGYIA